MRRPTSAGLLLGATGLLVAALAAAPAPAAAERVEGSAAGGTTVRTASFDRACPGAVPEDGFVDVAAGSTHEEAVDCAVWWKLARGISGDRFGADATTTRAQMATVIANLINAAGGGLPDDPADGFDDDAASVHERAIDQLAAVEVVRGEGGRTYDPARTVDRGTFATFLVRAYEFVTGTALTAERDHFTDDDGTTHEDSINAAAEAGFASGRGDGRYEPGGPVSRAQTASFLARVADRLVAEGHADVPPVTLIAAGDIAKCGRPGAARTAAQLDGVRGTIAALGDLAYERGTAAEFRDCWAPTWGRHDQRVRPAVGNHEYYTRGAAGYYDYWGDRAGTRGEGWYSYDLGPDWHVVVLNTMCTVVDCTTGSEQERWLRQDLAAHADRNVVAYSHHPRYSSGIHGSDPMVAPFWEALHEAGAELVLSGHDHDYERFRPMDAAGTTDPGGMRQFVSGAGGNSLRSFGSPLPSSDVRYADEFGLLVLTLHPDRYEWRFVTVDGETADAGSNPIR